jgi:hypothetical protein
MDESPKRGLLASYGRLLGPLIRILIRNGVSFDEFSDAAREIYVDVATSKFGVGNKKSSITRTAILAGIPIEEVREIRAAQDSIGTGGLDSNLNRIATILSAWHTDSDFTGPYGVPLELKFEGKDGATFEALVRQHLGEIAIEPLLNELVSVGAVTETEKGWFRVLTRFYIPKGAAPAGMDHLSRSVEDFVTTLDHNALENDPRKRMFERQTYTADGIRPEDLPRFKDFTTTRAKLLLEEIDNWLSQLEKPSEKNDSSKKHMVTGLGIYHYVHTNDASDK